MNTHNKDYITQGPITKSLITLAFPIMISQLMQTLYNLADTLWVGRVGAEAVAAISISFPIVFLMVSVAGGLTIAGTALIAQHKGAGNDKQVDKVLGQLFTTVGSFAVFIAIVGVLISKRALILMGADTAILSEATTYLRTIFAGIPFMFCFFIFSATLRGVGDTVTPTILMVISVVMNIVLDPLLIFGVAFFPEFGVQGAALATIFSRAVVTVFALRILFKGSKGVHLKLENMKPEFETISTIFRIGIPSSIERAMFSFGQIIMTSLVASFGTMTIAAYGIVNRLINLPVILAFGLSAASTTMVGQNIGAGRQDRAQETARVSLILIFVGLTIIGGAMALAPRALVSIFNKAPEVLDLGSTYLRMASLAAGFIGIRIVGGGILKGAGKTIPPMVVAIAVIWVFRLPLGYLFARFLSWNQLGLWLSMALSNVGGAFVILIWMRASNWSKKVIKSDPVQRTASELASE